MFRILPTKVDTNNDTTIKILVIRQRFAFFLAYWHIALEFSNFLRDVCYTLPQATILTSALGLPISVPFASIFRTISKPSVTWNLKKSRNIVSDHVARSLNCNDTTGTGNERLPS
jgi:hypothetical protein